MEEKDPKNTYQFQGDSGIPFCARILTKGTGYGRWDGQSWALTHDKERPVIEFYDARYSHTPFGQFVSRYFVDTLKDCTRGLVLDAGSPRSHLSATEVALSIHALVSEEAPAPDHQMLRQRG
jgi:hypothetical protein